MDRSRLILIILVTIGLAGGIGEFYQRYRENAQRKIALAEAQRKAAIEAEKQAQLKAEAEKKKAAAAAAETARLEEAKRLAEGGKPAGGTQEAPPIDVTIGTPKSLPGAKPAGSVAPPLRPLMDAPPPPDKPVPVIAVAEKWITDSRLTSTLMGVPRLAVINKLEFQQGQRVALPGGMAMQLSQIEDGYVVFESEGYRFKMRLKTVKD